MSMTPAITRLRNAIESRQPARQRQAGIVAQKVSEMTSRTLATLILE